ncbi:MAG: exodeoxyribonuclease VII small subunit [Clostridiaceae bacterium]|nr:exodeoxyribonuclease VII small subunit [Clostridiaceae bacterium]
MKDANFEETMENLEKIATELESGELSLEESVSKFEEGMKLSKKCNDIIGEAEKKITILLQKNNKIVEEEFSCEEKQ